MLDAGSGSRGSSLREVIDSWKIIGLEFGVSEIRKSRERQLENYDYVLASITHIPFRNDVFDVIINIDVLEHVAEKLLSIKNFYHGLKENGVLIGSTTNLYNPVMFFDCKLPNFIVKVVENKFTSGFYERKTRVNPNILCEVLKQSNYNKYQVTMFGLPQFDPWLFHTRQKKVSWFGYIWIFFDKITNFSKLRIFKEIIVFIAKK